jgi:hypothetical protein
VRRQRRCTCAEDSAKGRSDDRPLPPGQSLQPGTRVVTPRRGYRHHGIYVGRGTVIHYGGLVRGRHRGPVEEVSLEQFTNGRPLWVRYERSPCFDPDEVIRRARSRVGENRYRLLTNNCEHFCEWCLRAEHRSYQVDEWLSRPHRALRMMSCVELRTTMFLDHMQALLRGLVSRLFGSVAHTIRSLGTNFPETTG